MKKILHKLTFAQNPSQYEAHPSYYEEILCKVLTVQRSLQNTNHRKSRQFDECAYLI